MKNIMIAFIVLCFTATVGNTCEENKSENTIINKITNKLSNEKQEIIEYQKKGWEKGKIQNAKNLATIKSWFVKD
jgi:hypothetical protein|tara:strand:+ start:568 stop:792 length:225 start_codon:yes stop_codon:yes gene_type:complete